MAELKEFTLASFSLDPESPELEGDLAMGEGDLEPDLFLKVGDFCRSYCNKDCPNIIKL